MVASSNLAILNYMKHLNHYINMNETSNNRLSYSYWVSSVINNTNNQNTSILKDTNFNNLSTTQYSSLLNNDKTVNLNSTTHSSNLNAVILNYITKRSYQLSEALKTKDLYQLSKLIKYYDQSNFSKAESLVINEIINNAKNLNSFNTLTSYNNILKTTTSNSYLWKVNLIINKNHVLSKKRTEDLFKSYTNLVGNNPTNNLLLKDSRLNTWYNIINIKFTQKEYLYTKLKYSRTPAYDIVSGGSAALLAALFGFLIAEKSGFEMLDGADWYCLFMYGVFISLIIRSFVSSISLSDGIFYHLNPKHFLKHISYLLKLVLTLFK